MAAKTLTPRYGSDVMADLLASVGIDVVALNPGASLRGLQDSLVNYGGDRFKLVLCTHEGVAVAVAQGWAKATGKPMAVMLHDVVGLQHASMAIFNAWCDRVPMLIIGGTGPVSKAERRPWIDWIHTAHAQAQVVRDFVKWDDQPADVASLPESFVRAYQTTRNAPTGPVYLCLDTELQEKELARVPDLSGLAGYAAPTPPAPGPAEIAWIAERCRTARRPVIVTDYAGDSETGYGALVAFAEAIGAPVVDRGARCSFPTAHELCFSGIPEILDEADFILGLDVEDLYGAIGKHVFSFGEPLLKKARPVAIAHVSPAHYKLRAWSHDYQALLPLDLSVSATAETALGPLLEAIRREPPAPSVLAARREAVAGRVAKARRAWKEEAAAARGPAGTIHQAQLAAALRDAVASASVPWVLTSGSLNGWEKRLWSFERPRQHLGWHAGGGLGYGLGASIGAALAIGTERLCIDLQNDGDYLFTPSALWTAAHMKAPVLIVMNNNRQYQNTVEHAGKLAAARGRPVENRYVGSSLAEPAVDFARLASGYGVWSAGPITSAEELPAVLAKAIEVVRSGRPALVDVVTPGA